MSLFSIIFFKNRFFRNYIVLTCILALLILNKLNIILKNVLGLISYIVNIKKYNPYEQKFFDVLNNFQECEGVLRPKI